MRRNAEFHVLCTGAEVGVAAGAAEGGKALGTAAAIAAEDAAIGAAFSSAAGGLSGASTLAAIGTAEAAAIGGIAGNTLSGAFGTLKDVGTVLSPISSLAQVGQAMSAADRPGMLTGAPQVTPATPMPTGNTIPATRASIAEQLTRRGRAATILTSPSGEKLGA